VTASRPSSESEGRAFSESRDSPPRVDWSKAERVRLPSLEPSTKAILLRPPIALLERIKRECPM
jgi:hypothetical protein